MRKGAETECKCILPRLPFYLEMGNGEWGMGNGRARVSAPFLLQLCAVRRAVCALSGACRRHYVVIGALAPRRLWRHIKNRRVATPDLIPHHSFLIPLMSY